MTTFNEDVLINGSLQVYGTDDVTQVEVRGTADQSQPLQTWADSTGDPLTQVTSDGRLELGTLDMGTPDALIEANNAITLPSSAPLRGVQSLGRVTANSPQTLGDGIAWSVHELELLGNAAVSGIHAALRGRLTQQNTGDADQAELRAADFEAINETGYEYDQLNRRTALTDPLSHAWQTEYEDLAGGGTRITLTDPSSHETERAFDRLGRLKTIDYLNESPKCTPDVTFTYNLAGSRAAMVEDDGAANVRATGYTYDRARRMTQVDFDTDGDGNTDETVRYEYDAGGLRTRLILPGVGDPSITYAYDAADRLTQA